MRKGILTAGLFLLLTASEIHPVWASQLPEIDSEGPENLSEEELQQLIDEYMELTGSPAESNAVMETEVITDAELQMEYTGQGKFRYTLPNRAVFTVNTPEGMITEKEVRIELPTGAFGTVEKDNEEVSVIKDGVFTESGFYHLNLIFYQAPSIEIEDYNVYKVSFDFTIIGDRTNSIENIYAPDQFEISEVSRDGTLLTVTDPNIFRLEEDGVYEIRYRDLKTGKIRLDSKVIRDTEAPYLTFSKDITAGPVSGPVEFTPSEPDSIVLISYNGNRGQAVTNTLTSEGRYELEVQDTAGNSRIYQVAVREPFTLIDVKLVIVALIFLIGLIGRLLYLRRNMKVI